MSYNLPPQPTPFIGRDAELAEIARLLADPACRLLTLVGAGGIGKTRLAIEVARKIAFPNGVCFIPLQSLESPSLIASAIADALDFQFDAGGDLQQQLIDYLCEKSLLLVLDNFEHLLGGVPLLSKLLAHAPELKFLVTSRERLNLLEEWIQEVQGLPFPASDIERDIGSYNAVRLFMQSALRVKSGLSLSSVNKLAIIRICRLVGGMPLGIELAAGWTRVLSCSQIADEIERSLDILETTARNIEPRHSSIRAVFEPTWNRLTEAERSVFMKMSVFRGGFTREAAEQVTEASLRILSALVDKSLLRVDANGRYDLHELLRQYASDKLLTAGEAQAAAQQHLDYFLKLAEEAEVYAFGREQVNWLSRVEVEMDNFRAALSWSLETEKGLRLVVALACFFGEQAPWKERFNWLEKALAANPDAPASLRAKALHSAGELADNVGDAQQAQSLCEQALALARAVNDRWNMAWSLVRLGSLVENDPRTNTPFLEEGQALFRELGDPMGLTFALIRRSYNAFDQRDYPVVRSVLEEAAKYAHEAGDKQAPGWIAFNQGRLCLYHDDFRQARPYFEDCVSFFREAKFQVGCNIGLIYSIGTEHALGNLERAQLLSEEFLISQQIINPGKADNRIVLSVVASLSSMRGHLERATRLFGAADSSHWFYSPRYYHVPFSFEVEITGLRTQLGEFMFTGAWEAGKAMTARQAMAYALEDETAPIEKVQLLESVGLSLSKSLTEREIEILSLMAEGLSNRDIAERLFLTSGTVKWYLSQIYGKLGVKGRVQAVARARELALLI